MCVQCEIKRESCCLATPALLDRGNVVESVEAPMVGMDGVITMVGGEIAQFASGKRFVLSWSVLVRF